MNRLFNRFLNRFLLAPPAFLLLAACVQTRQPQADLEARQRVLEQRQRQQQMEEYRRSVGMRLEDAETQLADAQREIRRLEGELAQRPSREDLDGMGRRIAALEEMIRTLEARRERDREELIKTLSQRMSDIMATQQARAARAAGRVHVVAAGETLSAIAAAYRVGSADIIRANNLENPNALRIGQKLAIPAN